MGVQAYKHQSLSAGAYNPHMFAVYLSNCLSKVFGLFSVFKPEFTVNEVKAETNKAKTVLNYQYMTYCRHAKRQYVIVSSAKNVSGKS